MKARAHELRTLVVAGWAPIVGLLLLAALQNVDVIMAKREMTASDAGAYAAAVVAAKLVVWVAIGIGLHLLPEATRRVAAGVDPRPVLLRALGLLAIVAVPSLIVFTVAPETLLRVAFGEEFVSAADALPILGLAMTLLAVSTLAVQYMLALHRTAFLCALGGRGDRRAAAAERRRRRDAVVRGDRARRPGRRGGGVSRAGPAGAPGAGGRGGRAGALGADRRRARSAAGAEATSCGRRRSARRRRP